MKVEYTALKRNFSLYADEYEEATLRALRSGWYILGPELKTFEEAFAEKFGVKHCIGVNSGTDALILAIRSLGIGEGDEVIVPAGTYIASVLGVTENGATPVYVDSNEHLLIDADAIEAAITKRTKAILPVHMYGQACDMSVICDIAARHNLYVIEDCAQCHGAMWDGKLAGTFGTVGCFSFYPTKPLGAFGDAGAILTDDDDIADRLRMLRNYGSRIKYQNESIGVNSRLDEIQAAILSVGLKHLDENNKIRTEAAERYLNEIVNEKIKLPTTHPKATHTFHLFPILTEDRDGLAEYLKSKGIGTAVHYPIPPFVAQCYASYGYKWEDYPKAAYIARHELSLPIYAGIPQDEVSFVIEALNSY